MQQVVLSCKVEAQVVIYLKCMQRSAMPLFLESQHLSYWVVINCIVGHLKTLQNSQGITQTNDFGCWLVSLSVYVGRASIGTGVLLAMHNTASDTRHCCSLLCNRCRRCTESIECCRRYGSRLCTGGIVGAIYTEHSG